jgi:magnesium transporter
MFTITFCFSDSSTKVLNKKLDTEIETAHDAKISAKAECMHTVIDTEQIESLIKDRDVPGLQELVSQLLPVELVDLIESLSSDEQIFLYSILSPKLSVKTFELLPLTLQKNIFYSLPSDRAAQIFNELAPDDRTAFLEEMTSAVVHELIKLLSPKERAVTLKLLGYPENSVGRLMTPDYIAVSLDLTVSEVLEFIRNFGPDKETVDVIYVVDNKGVLLDDIKIKEFLFASPTTKVYDVSDHRFVALYPSDDQEKAIVFFKRTNRVALPVIDSKGILLGIVTYDDVLNLLSEEDTEDMQKIGGMAALDEPYMHTPFFHLMKKRVGWLTVLFLGEMLTATALAFFEDEISRAVVLALFLPLIISSGGNSGSQASTLVIRALAIGEITLRDWWKIMKREIFSGLFLGTVLGLIGFLRISLWATFSDIYGPHWILIAITIFFSLIGVVLWGTLSGSMLPLLLRRLGVDPATSSAPFVATLVDVTGVIIYFYIALIVLKGTLL